MNHSNTQLATLVLKNKISLFITKDTQEVKTLLDAKNFNLFQSISLYLLTIAANRSMVWLTMMNRNLESFRR